MRSKRLVSMLVPLGAAMIYLDRRTGNKTHGPLVQATEDDLDEMGMFGAEFGYDDFGDDDDDDFGADDDDDFGDDDDDDFGYLGDDDDDDFGDDDDDDFGDEFGARKRRGKRRRARRPIRRPSPAAKKWKRRAIKAKRAGRRRWGFTVISETEAITAVGGGVATARVRLQHDFKAQDLTFEGTLPSTVITSLTFGDRQIITPGDGVPINVFATTGQLRKLLKGQELRAGLDITAQGTLPGAGSLIVTLTGYKPVN